MRDHKWKTYGVENSAVFFRERKGEASYIELHDNGCWAATITNKKQVERLIKWLKKAQKELSK